MSIYIKTLEAVVLLCNNSFSRLMLANGRSDRGTKDSLLFDKSKILRVKHRTLSSLPLKESSLNFRPFFELKIVPYTF